MIRIDEVSTPNTLKTIRKQDGTELILKGGNLPTNPGDNYTTNYLKLYKKTKVDGLDTFQLVAQKEEKHHNNGGSFISILKERFNPKTGKLTEQSCISQNISGGKNIECTGDVFSIQGSVCTSARNKVEAIINTSKGELTPIAKRILKTMVK